ncbi:MAG: hypothetical protein KIH69_019780 [Anaerolineae bacterium]|nr:hypothetical protein [Anaerolineae bacterium]
MITPAPPNDADWDGAAQGDMAMSLTHVAPPKPMMAATKPTLIDIN